MKILERYWKSIGKVLVTYWKLLIALTLCTNLAIIGELVGTASAHLMQRADLNEWFNGLKSGSGNLCCSNNDGATVQDAEWDTYRGPDGKSHFRVMIEGKWIEVPDNAVVTEPNKAGVAMVWATRYWYPSAGASPTYTWTIRCFMPGVMG